MRPPKSVRRMLIESGQWQVHEPSPPPFSPAEKFSDVVSEVLPMPGAYQPVFNAFKHLDDVEYTYNGAITEVADLMIDVLETEQPNPEAFESLGLSYETAARTILQVSCGAIAQRVASAHQTMFASIDPITSLPVPKLPIFIAEYVALLGEFPGPDGRRWLLSDYEATVRAFLRAAHRIKSGADPYLVLREIWLPVSTDDGRTSHVIAIKLHEWFIQRGFHFEVKQLKEALFGGEVPSSVSAILSQLDKNDIRIVARLFTRWSTDHQFLSLFSDGVGVDTLLALGLTWAAPSVQDLNFLFDQQRFASHLLNGWRLKWREYESVFGCPFRGPTHNDRPVGSYIQAVKLGGLGIERQVSSHYALSEVDKTVISCYGQPIEFGDIPTRYFSRGFLEVEEPLRRVIRYHLCR